MTEKCIKDAQKRSTLMTIRDYSLSLIIMIQESTIQLSRNLL